MPNIRSTKVLLDLLKKKTVVELKDIRTSLGEVSSMTAFRYLKKIPYRRSYNHNGRYYCLHEPSRYDSLGFFYWKGMHFSMTAASGAQFDDWFMSLLPVSRTGSSTSF